MALANQSGLSSKYVSERHHYASCNKYTAGEAAKKISKQLKSKVYAKELVEAFKMLKGHEPEWHHAGFYKYNGKSTMGRTFFFTDEEIDNLVNNWNQVSELKAKKEAEEKVKAETIIYGFYYIWDKDYSGSYGRKRNFKRLQWYKGSELNVPRNFTSCNKSFYEKHKEITASYYGWDEPTVTEIEGRL